MISHVLHFGRRITYIIESARATAIALTTVLLLRNSKCLWLVLVVGGICVLWPHCAWSQTGDGSGHPQLELQAVKYVRGGSQEKMSDESAVFKVMLGSSRHCTEALSGECFDFRVVAKRTQGVTTFRLANETAQVESLSIVGHSQLLIVGRPQTNLAIVTLVSLPLGKEIDRIVCNKSSLSLDRQFVVFLKFTPAHPGYNWSPSEEYVVYDLASSPQENRTPPNRSRSLEPYDAGWPIYPEDATNLPGDNMLEGRNNAIS